MENEKEATKISLTVKSEIWKVFAENCRRAGMTPSRVIEVFMLCMIDTYPTERLQKFVNVANGMRKVLSESAKEVQIKEEGP